MFVTITLTILIVVLGVVIWLVYQKQVTPSPTPSPPSPTPVPPPSPSPTPVPPPSPSPTPVPPPTPTPVPPPTPTPVPPPSPPPTPTPVPSPSPTPEVRTFKCMMYSRETLTYLSYKPGFSFAPNAIDNSEYGVWDIHFLGDYLQTDTPFVLQVPGKTEVFQNLFMSSLPYHNHSPSMQESETIWYPVNATEWSFDGISVSRDMLIQSGHTNKFLGPVGWNPTEQKEKNGATLWTCVLFNVPPSNGSITTTKSYGYLEVDEPDYKYIIYDNAKGKYVPRLGLYDLQNLWLFHLSIKDVSIQDQWIVEIQVPVHVQVDHFPAWFMSSNGKGKGNDAHATKNRHAPCMDPESNNNTKWTVHVIGLESKSETETVYRIHLEANNHNFLSAANNVGIWRPSLVAATGKPEILGMKLVLLNGATLPSS